jgi:hypothetical protein
MYYIAITTDVETFSPSVDGQIEINIAHQITVPLKILLGIADQNDVKLTMFLEIFQFFRFIEIPEYSKQMDSLVKLISSALENGHEIQLHTHSEWITAKYSNGKWYRSFTGPDSVHGIFDVFCKELDSKINALICLFPSINLSCFRAGAYQIQPERILFNELKKHGIKLDSSRHKNELTTLSKISDLISAPILGKFPTVTERWDMNLNEKTIFYFFNNRSAFDPNSHGNFKHFGVMTGHTKMPHDWAMLGQMFRMLRDDDLVESKLLSDFITTSEEPLHAEKHN